jgi:hypothetical protein
VTRELPASGWQSQPLLISYCHQRCPHCWRFMKWEWYTARGYPVLVTCGGCDRRFPLTTKPHFKPDLTHSVFV